MDPYQVQAQTRARKFLLLIFLGGLVLFGVYWVYSHSYIAVDVTGQTTNETITYTVTNQSTGKSYTLKSSDKSIKKLLLKGSYEVTVTQSGKSMFALQKAKGFLTTARVSSGLTSEHMRTFIGNNPNPCMYYDGSLLYTYSCDGDYESLQLHKPASTSIATTVTTPLYPPDYQILGMTKIGGQDYTLLQGDLGSGDEKLIQKLFFYPLASDLSVNPDLVQASGIVLSGTNYRKDYSFAPLDNGFVITSTDGDDVLYYPQPSSQPKKLEIPKPVTSAMKFSGVSTRGNKVATYYSTNLNGESTGQDVDVLKKGKTTVEIYDTSSDTKSELKIKSGVTSVKLCGDENLCVLRGRVLDVYKVSGQKINKLYEITGVYDLLTQGSDIKVVRNNAVLSIQTEGGAGFVEYSMGEYQYCGGNSVNNSSYVVCLINSKNDKVALYIKNEPTNEDGFIDKKIARLLNSPDIDTLSIYKNIIYISPNLGSRQYIPELQGYGYSPDLIKESSINITNDITKIGIDRSKYLIVNPYAN